MATKGDKIRRGVFWSYIILSLILLLGIVYTIFDRVTILMYRPVGMEDEGISKEIIDELSRHIGVQMEYLLLFGVFVCINILIAVALFVATRKTFKKS
jgi:hypothetical protein